MAAVMNVPVCVEVSRAGSGWVRRAGSAQAASPMPSSCRALQVHGLRLRVLGHRADLDGNPRKAERQE